MQYMLIMNTPRDGYTQFMKWPKTILEANMAFMQAFSQKLTKTGELVITAGLAAPDKAKKVRAGKDGKPITDGVFPESKEFLAGWWIVEVDSEARALEIAAEAATAPGTSIRNWDGTMIDHLWVEVREVLGSHRNMR
jgi:hypothetical protein